MRRAAAFLLCIALCLTLLPVAAGASGTVQYAAVTATQPDWSDAALVTDHESAESAAAEPDCVAVVACSLDAAPGSPAALEGDLVLHGRTLILSNVALAGDVICDELLLLGEASMTPTGAGYVITGTSVSGSPKGALAAVEPGSAGDLLAAVGGAEKRYTVTVAASIDSHLQVYDMVVDEGATLHISAPDGEGVNALLINHSLVVNGTLSADDRQLLELRDNASVSGEGLMLYQEDGSTEYFVPGEHGVLAFEWNGTCWRLLGGGGGGGAGALEGMDGDAPGHYVIASDCTVTPGDSVNLSLCTITVNADVTLTVEANARMELCGVTLNNNGTIVIEADPAEESPEHGRIELRDDRFHDEGTGEDIVTPGSLVNDGAVTVNGNLEFNDGAELTNNASGTVTVNNFLRLAEGAVLSNTGTVAGGEGGRIELFVDDGSGAPPLSITGLSFYDSAEDAAADNPTEDLRGLFSYDSGEQKWVYAGSGGGDGGDGGDTTTYTIVATAGENGTISPAGSQAPRQGENWHFDVTPAPGYRIASLEIDGVALSDLELQVLLTTPRPW